MPDTTKNPFYVLVDKYGDPVRIPDEELYRCINSSEMRKTVYDAGSLGLERLKAFEIVQEVRRRCEQDLWFLGKYFLWDTDVANGGDLPIEENMMCEHVHRRVCDVFIKKDKTKKIADQDTRKERLILYPRGTGKALDIDTLIPTPEGFARMGDIRVGDVVLSSTGAPCTVVNTSPVFTDHECYEVEFSTGEIVVADGDHRWITETKRQREASRNGNLKQKSVPIPSIKTTKEIQETLEWGNQKNHRVRVAGFASLPDRCFPISPYVLGCWLGDGTSACGSLTNVDQEIIDEIRAEGEPIRKSENPNDKYLWRFNGGPDHPTFGKQKLSFAGRLRKLGVLNNKHIPIEYRRGSASQRLALLQGLMDTDGTCDKRGLSSFCSTNKILAEQTKELAASLGLKPGRISENDSKINGRIVGKDYSFVVTAYADTTIFRLSRKKIRQPQRKKHSYQDYRHITDVRKITTRPVRCITVDSPDHTYLVGPSYIATHNSAWDRYDTVQWVLNFPDIRILYLTAEQSLAEGFVKETKNHFLTRPDEPSLMNLYFPEYCFSEQEAGVADKLTCPLWTAKKIERKEPTVWGSSIVSNLSGKHFEVIKADDSVGDENSNTEEMCEKINRKFVLKRKMLLPTGYVDKIGTRYADEDMYGVDIEKNVGDLRRESGSCWERIDNLTNGSIILIGRSIVIKPETIAQLEKDGKPVTYKEAGPEGCDLLFPERHSYSWCLLEYGKDEKIFEGQQNQNPRSASSVIFDLPLLKRHTVSFEQMPLRGPISHTWDFAFSKKKGRDYSTASSCIWNDKGHFYVHDLIRARFTPTGLAKAVVDFAMKWRPFVIGIEDCSGSRFLEPSIISEAEKTGRPDIVDLCTHIDWYKPDNQKDAKNIRMGSLHPWLTSDRMWFANYLPFLDVLYGEFEKCLTSHHHDDIPDVLAYQLRFAPKMQQLIEKKELETFSSSDAAWNLLFGGSGELYGGMQGNDCDPFGRLGFGPPPMPILAVEEEPDEMRAESPYDDAPAILGSGLFG